MQSLAGCGRNTPWTSFWSIALVPEEDSKMDNEELTNAMIEAFERISALERELKEIRDGLIATVIERCDGNHSEPACADKECWLK